MALYTKHTRFRAYQIKTKGSSFSYWDGTYFTLCEARYNPDNKNSILHELMVCGKSSIDTLHITSWDNDHCNPDELNDILRHFYPSRIERPGYEPHSNDGKKSALLISVYAIDRDCVVLSVNPEIVKHLDISKPWDYTNVLYDNAKNSENSNDNSSIKLFRSGCFNVLSLGDVESENVSKYLCMFPITINEIDILLLSHHGSDNALNSSSFLDSVKPSAAVALCNWSNQHGHPDQNVLRRLSERGISYYSTKQGDVIIESVGDHLDSFQVWNYISDGNRLESVSKGIKTKKAINWYKSFV